METTRTIRNCLPQFRFTCPKRWDELTPTGDAAIRHCDQCDRAVYFCTTDEETIAHARAGDCIAREMPVDVGRVVIGRPAEVQPPTPEQLEARRVKIRERGVDDAIHNAATATRSCPRCQYPAPDWRLSCRVCGFEFGRVPES